MNKTLTKFMLLDGNSLAHRAFYALPLLTNRQGVFTNAAFGFTTMLFKLLGEEKPDYVAVAFDMSRATFRQAEYAEYKAHRKATPDELRPQIPLIKRILQAAQIGIYEKEGYEADDLIGTLSRVAEAEGMLTLIVTGDRDALQLVSPDTRALITRKGISVLEIYGEEEIYTRYGLAPVQLIDVKALMGDASDNIPGVPGIGEKTALKLIQEYGSLEEILTNVDHFPKSALTEKLKTYAEQARLSKRLGTIDRSVPVDVYLEDCRYPKTNNEELLTVFKELEFNRLIPGLVKQMAENKRSSPCTPEKESPSYILLDTQSKINQMLKQVAEAGEASISLRLSGTDYLKADLEALAISSPGSEPFLLDFNHLQCTREEVLHRLGALLSDQHIKLYFHDAKAALVVFHRLGCPVGHLVGDTMIAGYLLNPTASAHDLPSLSLEHLDLPLSDTGDRAEIIERATIVGALIPVLHEKLKQVDMEKLYHEVELPLARVLAGMEMFGFTLDVAQLKNMSGELATRIEQVSDEIYQIAGEKFNIHSTRQLAVILFEKLKLPTSKKTKTGYSTNAQVLEDLAAEHEIVAMVLEHRQLAKLKSTYVEGLQVLANPSTGKVHTTFNQTVTATGRLSSTEPNLQNIPIRMELGRRIRRAFIPSIPGWVILAADYSQIELRVLAHFSGDASLIDAFKHNRDIHTYTAAEVFGVPMDQVSYEMRRRAKAVNFGIVYGISDFGLARDLGISRKEASEYIKLYFARYHGVKRYMEEVVEEARQKGYVCTMLNRRRYLPDLFSPNYNVRNFGERTAINTPIQGSAADIIKLAMILVDGELEKRKLSSRMILQVHDELIFEVPPEELGELAALTKSCMEDAVQLQVPLGVDLKTGDNWHDLSKILI
ncbi:MAG: DNA polymerase I [Bacillota bacterium]